MSGTLYVVATPIGNLEDMTPRAVRVLGEVDVIYAEDTRHTRPLLAHFGINKPLRSLHEHNERQRGDEVLRELEEGKRLALVTDAGTPGVSDPGSLVVAAAAARGFAVVPIPGVSALATALSVAGFDEPEAGVLFLGFLPVKGGARAKALDRIAAHAGIAVLYEAPHRIGRTLEELAVASPERPAMLSRELTKVYEELRRGTLAELATGGDVETRGEMTLVVGPAVQRDEAPGDEAVEAAVRRCLEAGLSARDAATAVATLVEGVSRRDAYKVATRLKDDAG